MTALVLLDDCYACGGSGETASTQVEPDTGLTWSQPCDLCGGSGIRPMRCECCREFLTPDTLATTCPVHQMCIDCDATRAGRCAECQQARQEAAA